MQFQSLFSEEKIKLLSAEFAQRVVKVKTKVYKYITETVIFNV